MQQADSLHKQAIKERDMASFAEEGGIQVHRASRPFNAAQPAMQPAMQRACRSSPARPIMMPRQEAALAAHRLTRVCSGSHARRSKMRPTGWTTPCSAADGLLRFSLSRSIVLWGFFRVHGGLNKSARPGNQEDGLAVGQQKQIWEQGDKKNRGYLSITIP